MKQEPKKFEKKELGEKREEIKEFMKEEYMKSAHFKKKIENYKINKVMGRIRKRAKGPNPLSVKKKSKPGHDNISKKDGSNSEAKGDNLLNNTETQVTIKRERKRFKKNKKIE